MTFSNLDFRGALDELLQYIEEMSFTMTDWVDRVDSDTLIYSTVSDCGEEVIIHTIKAQTDFSTDVANKGGLI